MAPENLQTLHEISSVYNIIKVTNLCSENDIKNEFQALASLCRGILNTKQRASVQIRYDPGYFSSQF